MEKSSLVYAYNEHCNAEEMSQVFIQSGIRRPSHDLERLQRMIDHADAIVTVREEGRLVGVLRAITDYSYCCYISDLAVDKDYQGRGIGKKLIERLKYELGEEEIKYILVSAPTATGFYDQIGFKRADKAYVIDRKR